MSTGVGIDEKYYVPSNAFGFMERAEGDFKQNCGSDLPVKDGGLRVVFGVFILVGLWGDEAVDVEVVARDDLEGFVF